MTEKSRRDNKSEWPPVVPLKDAPGERASWDRPLLTVLAWSAAELLLVYNPWQISSRLRTAVLRAFGAEIGPGVIMRPRTRVRFPWKLQVGANSWIGEGVWVHNQDHVRIGHDTVISQDTFLTTGSHAHRSDMGLRTKSIDIGDGVWITSRCMILGGTEVGQSSIARPMSRLSGTYPPNSVIDGVPAKRVGSRFDEPAR